MRHRMKIKSVEKSGGVLIWEFIIEKWGPGEFSDWRDLRHPLALLYAFVVIPGCRQVPRTDFVGPQDDMRYALGALSRQKGWGTRLFG